jgi:hypothetical protein
MSTMPGVLVVAITGVLEYSSTCTGVIKVVSIITSSCKYILSTVVLRVLLTIYYSYK